MDVRHVYQNVHKATPPVLKDLQGEFPRQQSSRAQYTLTFNNLHSSLAVFHITLKKVQYVSKLYSNNEDALNQQNAQSLKMEQQSFSQCSTFKKCVTINCIS